MRVCVCVSVCARALLLPCYNDFFLSNRGFGQLVPKTPTGRVGTGGQRRRRRVDPPASRGLVDFLGDAVGLPPVAMAPAVAPRATRRPRPSWSSQQGSGPLPCVAAWPSAPGAALDVAPSKLSSAQPPAASPPRSADEPTLLARTEAARVRAWLLLGAGGQGQSMLTLVQGTAAPTLKAGSVAHVSSRAEHGQPYPELHHQLAGRNAAVLTVALAGPPPRLQP